METTLLFRWLLLALLMSLSAFFAGTEVALFSLSRAQVRALQEQGAIGRRVAALLDKPQKLLVSIYIGNELVNVAISSVVTFIALDLFGDAGLAVAIGVGTFALLIFGEITPKTVAHYHNVTWAKLAAWPLTIYMILITPLQVTLTKISAWLADRVTSPSTEKSDFLTEEELITAMEEGADEGVIDEDEKEMIQNVFDFGDITASEVMTPRTDIFALDADSSLREAWDRLAETSYARAPIYRGSLDTLEGVLYKKDLLRFDYPPPEEATLEELRRKPLVAPATLSVSELLRTLKMSKTHIAFLLDEYGGLAGLVTMDDIIREVVGESLGQREEESEPIKQTGPHRFEIDASLDLDAFNEKMGATLSHDDIETIGGYVFHLFGRAPEAGESVAMEGMSVEVTEVTGRRIRRITIERSAPTTDAEEG